MWKFPDVNFAFQIPEVGLQTAALLGGGSAYSWRSPTYFTPHTRKLPLSIPILRPLLASVCGRRNRLERNI